MNINDLDAGSLLIDPEVPEGAQAAWAAAAAIRGMADQLLEDVPCNRLREAALVHLSAAAAALERAR